MKNRITEYDLTFFMNALEEYENCSPRGRSEIDREDYLRSLSKGERYFLLHLFKSFNLLWRNELGFAALAVGTTTFKGNYWSGLRKYLEKNDPKKLSFVQKRGEDIDIMICPDSYRLANCEKWNDWVKLDLEKADLKYNFIEDRKEDGTGYIYVPEEYKKKYGGIIRHKRIKYAKDNFIIYNTNGRDIHLSFSLIPIEFKLKDERIEDFSFCLLFRHSSYRDLEKIIRKVENQLELFQK